MKDTLKFYLLTTDRCAWGPGLGVTVGSNCLLKSQMGLTYWPLKGALLYMQHSHVFLKTDID